MSSRCVSACDAFVNRFKVSGRARIAGEATSGTGFGITAMPGNGENKYRDLLNLVENDNAFISKDGFKGSALEFEKLRLLENHPTMPDLEIKYSLNDITGNFRDYINSLRPILIKE